MSMIDAKGLACPQPVILAKKAVDGGESAFTVLVDNQTAVENLSRLADSNGFQTAVTEKDGVYEVAFSKDGAVPAAAAEPTQAAPGGGKWAVFASADSLGRGDPELGASLIKMCFYTLAQDDHAPDYILFMNAGVKLACNEEIAGHLRQMEQKGAEILVCGTCLNFFGIKDDLKIGTVSNMYDILERMKDAAKVITL